MRDPIQTIRGELACGLCYEENFRNDGLCPIDHEPISPNGFFEDRFKRTEIRHLKSYCINKIKGCPWAGEVGHVEGHPSKCSYQPECCLFCNKSIEQTQIEHLQECVELITHRNCFYKDYGCAFKPRNVNDHIAHLKDISFIHSIMQNRYVERESACGLFKNECIHESAKGYAVRMQAEITFLNGQVFSLTNTIKEMQDKFIELQNGITNKIGKSFNIRSTSDKAIPSETDNLSLSATNKKISELDLKQQLYEKTTYNGKILWKIDNLKLRMQQAITGRITALHSAPCFSAKYGYKFCGRVYLNGDGMGKCTHLSMCVVIMKSDYDNLLQWPFQKNVIFRLIDQEDTSNHIEESFVPDRFSSSFQKPKNNMNVAAGCPMFISVEDLMSGTYIKDDSIFIEINVV